MKIVLLLAILITTSSVAHAKSNSANSNNLYCNDQYKLCINFPPNWYITNGTMSNVIKKAVEHKGGNLNINIITGPRKINNTDLDEFFTNEYLQEFSDALGSKFKNFAIIRHDKVYLGVLKHCMLNLKALLKGQK